MEGVAKHRQLLGGRVRGRNTLRVPKSTGQSACFVKQHISKLGRVMVTVTVTVMVS